MTAKPHDCDHHGHVWLETDGTPYTRHRGRSQADVPVTCQHCPATATLPAFAANTAPPQKMPPKIDLGAFGDLNIGSVPKR